MKVVAYICAALLGLIAAYLELMIIIHEPWQVLNPFLQFKVVIYFVTAPIVWLLVAVGAISLMVVVLSDKK